MSYTLNYTGSEIDDILARAVPGGALDTAIAAKQDALTFDNVPTSGSDNPVKSGGIYDAIQAGGAAALAAFATDSVSGDVVSFPDGADGIPVKSFSGTIVPQQSGSGDPAPDNIRPISGWTGASLFRTGANLFNAATATKDKFVDANGVIGTSVGVWSLSDYIPVKAGQTYTTIGGTTPSGPCNCFYDAEKNFLSSLPVATRTFTVPDGAYFVRLSFRLNATLATEGALCVGASASWSAYQGDTILLDFGTTVYVGTITALGGGLWKIQPTHAALTLNGSESWAAYASGNGYRLSVSGMASGEAQTGWADWLATVPNLASLGVEFGRNDTRIYAAQANTIPSVTNLASWQTYLGTHPLTILYPLATLPDPITITGEDLQTLLGSNTVWTDVGSVTGMTYRADTALYIQKLLNGGGTLSLSMASPSPSLSLGRVGVLAEPEADAEPEEVTEEPEADTEEATEE